MQFFITVFFSAIAVGAFVAALCSSSSKPTLAQDFILRVIGIDVIVSLGLIVIFLFLGGVQLGFVTAYALNVFVGPPIAGFAVGAFGFGGAAKCWPSRH